MTTATVNPTSPTSIGFQSITPAKLAEQMRSGAKSIPLIDVRTPVEFAEVHIDGALNMPLDQLDCSTISGPVYVVCKSGGRSSKACSQLVQAGVCEVVTVAGGVDAWVAAGLPVKRDASVMSLERQVRIAAGLLVLIGLVLGFWVSPWVYLLSAFVGAGLIFAGMTNFCGMGLLLAKMPWNKFQTGTCCSR